MAKKCEQCLIRLAGIVPQDGCGVWPGVAREQKNERHEGVMKQHSFGQVLRNLCGRYILDHF